MMFLFSSSVAWSGVISSNTPWLTIDAISFIIPCLSFSWSNPCGSLMMGSTQSLFYLCFCWIFTCCCCHLLSILQLYCDRIDASFCPWWFCWCFWPLLCLSVVLLSVLCCFDVLPSVMLLSNVLLDVGLPAGALAGVIDGANDVGTVVGCAGVSSVIVTFCFFDDDASSSIGCWSSIAGVFSSCVVMPFFCLLWCWCRAWQDEMWIVVWWTRCPWCTIDDVHQLSIVFPWFDLSPDGSCFDDLASNPNRGFSWWRVLSKPDAWIAFFLKFGILLDGWWWHVENAFSKLTDGSLVVWLPSPEVTWYSIAMDGVVVTEKSAVLDEPRHDWMLHANIETVVGSEVLSGDTCLSKESSMQCLDATLTSWAVGWWMAGGNTWYLW